MSSILILNGPNLNLLGTREPEVYGHTTLPQLEADAVAYGAERGHEVQCAQSNFEGGLVELIHGARGARDGIILNAGAYTHTSVALHDAIAGVALPTIELHISNVHARESFRHHSVIARACSGVICGFGVSGYRLAIDAMQSLLDNRP
ncbi:type II 3-dehydroquinate dehydratase [Roseobacteraceae bacterium S113]